MIISITCLGFFIYYVKNGSGLIRAVKKFHFLDYKTF